MLPPKSPQFFSNACGLSRQHIAPLPSFNLDASTVKPRRLYEIGQQYQRAPTTNNKRRLEAQPNIPAKRQKVNPGSKTHQEMLKEKTLADQEKTLADMKTEASKFRGVHVKKAKNRPISGKMFNATRTIDGKKRSGRMHSTAKDAAMAADDMLRNSDMPHSAIVKKLNFHTPEDVKAWPETMGTFQNTFYNRTLNVWVWQAQNTNQIKCQVKGLSREHEKELVARINHKYGYNIQSKINLMEKN